MALSARESEDLEFGSCCSRSSCDAALLSSGSPPGRGSISIIQHHPQQQQQHVASASSQERLALYQQMGFFGDSRHMALRAQGRRNRNQSGRLSGTLTSDLMANSDISSTATAPLLHSDIGNDLESVPRRASATGAAPGPGMATPSSSRQNLDYVYTMMYGRYTKELGSYAKDEARRVEKRRRHEEERRRRRREKELRGQVVGKAGGHGVVVGWVAKALSVAWRHTFARLGEDWVFLALLGIFMALLSFAMDYGVAVCTRARLWLYRDLAATHPALQLLAWISLPVFLVLFSAGFVHVVAPQAIGSGIPEMKTILRGVVLKEYLTFRTLVAKAVGLTAALGSGMPLGKEGPFVHVASVVATLLSKLVTSFQRLYENESRAAEMLAAACAVGVACCFAAPIGGVLFSIEVTAVYFAVRNYWRGFFAAVCGATAFRLLAVWFEDQGLYSVLQVFMFWISETLTPVFKTHLTREFPFDIQELLVFALLGMVSGLAGAGFVWGHRQYVIFMRRSKKVNEFLQKNRFVYPLLVSFAIASLLFPPGLGQFLAADLSTHDQVTSLFANFTWTQGQLTVTQANTVSHWTTPYSGVLINLALYICFTMVTSIVASTLPVPSGSLVPVFKIGAALGRLVGEAMALWFPEGFSYGPTGGVQPINPGGYAVVGAAALAGASTHTISISVIVFEMTGQITHIIPVMIAVLVANAVAALLQPSIYDSIILIKRLPYLPDILPSNAAAYRLRVADFMVRDVVFIWKGMDYLQMRHLLRAHRALRSFPLVDSPDSMILLGSIQRMELVKVLEKQVGRERRIQVAAKWQREAQDRAREQMEEERKRRQQIFLEQQEEERRRREALLEQQNRAAAARTGRRESRFEVVPAPDVLRLQQPLHIPPPSPLLPTKSILKKTNSFSLKSLSPSHAQLGMSTPYTTVTGAESRLRQAFEAVFRKAATLQDVNPDAAGVPGAATNGLPPPSPSIAKKVQLPKERVIDMSPEEQQAWEEHELAQLVKFEQCRVDPAPFQLVERTSLLKVHSLFSLLGVRLAYVTSTGRLVGVVALTELRKTIEECNSGTAPALRECYDGLDPESETSAGKKGGSGSGGGDEGGSGGSGGGSSGVGGGGGGPALVGGSASGAKETVASTAAATAPVPMVIVSMGDDPMGSPSVVSTTSFDTDDEDDDDDDDDNDDDNRHRRRRDGSRL